MQISLPILKRDETVAAVQAFITDALRRRRTLVEWQRNTGWMNWALNVAPLLRPALQSSYHKMTGRSLRNAPIFMNQRVTADLFWFTDVLSQWDGIHLLNAHLWDSSAADLVLYCDAALSGGLAFWSPTHSQGYVADKPQAPRDADHIFWFEALTVISALHWATQLPSPPHHLAIFTDSLNTVQLFDSLPYIYLKTSIAFSEKHNHHVQHYIHIHIWYWRTSLFLAVAPKTHDFEMHLPKYHLQTLNQVLIARA
jgi:hypothetical protein